MNPDAMWLADMSAVRSSRGLSFQLAETMRVRECIGLAVEAVNRLQPFPHGVAFAIPAEFVSIDQATRCDAPNDHPRKKAFASRQPQVTSRLPSSAARVVK